MSTKWRWTILGGGLGLYLVGLGFFFSGIVTVLNRYDQALQQSHASLIQLDQVAPAGREAREAPWTAHVRKADQALAERNVGAAELAWHEAFVAALRSRHWKGLLEVGDVYLRIGELARARKASEAKARQLYLAALFRARQQGSVEGVLRTAEAFAALGDREVVDQCLRIAEGLAAQARDAQARALVRAFAERLTARSVEAKSLEPDEF